MTDKTKGFRILRELFTPITGKMNHNLSYAADLSLDDGNNISQQLRGVYEKFRDNLVDKGLINKNQLSYAESDKGASISLRYDMTDDNIKKGYELLREISNHQIKEQSSGQRPL